MRSVDIVYVPNVCACVCMRVFVSLSISLCVSQSISQSANLSVSESVISMSFSLCVHLLAFFSFVFMSPPLVSVLHDFDHTHIYTQEMVDGIHPLFHPATKALPVMSHGTLNPTTLSPRAKIKPLVSIQNGHLHLLKVSLTLFPRTGV